ncbi:MAG: ABC transporter permease [Oscillospiraceae bacterium]|nr:ABC transporter permease [Oscillospiraceae bacterium]
MLAIYRREVHSYFTSPIGYLLIAFLLLMNGFYFTAYNLQNGYSNYGLVLYNTLIVLLVFCPLLTMRSFSEERRQKTDQLLLCAPVRTVEIVLAKFLACVTVIGVPFAVFCTCPLVLSLYGTVEFSISYGAIFAWLLMTCACLAVGVFFSSVTENQIVAALCGFAVLLLSYLSGGITSLVTSSAGAAVACLAVICLALGFLVWYMTRSRVLAGAAAGVGLVVLLALYLADSAAVVSALSAAMGAIDLFEPFLVFINGIFSVTSVVYYLSVIVLFLFLTVQSLERRRYN